MIWSCLHVILSQFWFLLIAYHSFTVSSSTSTSTSASTYFIRFISCPKYFSCHHNPTWQHYPLRKILQSFISSISLFSPHFHFYFSFSNTNGHSKANFNWLDSTETLPNYVTQTCNRLLCLALPCLALPCFAFSCCAFFHSVTLAINYFFITF